MTEPRRPLPPADEELWSLAEKMADGTATAADRDRLDARLRGAPDGRLFYVAFLDLHAHLQWRTRGAAGRPAARRPRPGRRPRLAVAAALALAAGLLVALCSPASGPRKGSTPTSRTPRTGPSRC
jgi:hypothetical protein